MQRSESIVNLAKALAQAQGELQNPTKSTKNTFFNSKYADLAEVLNVVREVLPGFGLSIVQNPDFDVQASILTMETILLHESGEWMSSSLRCPVPPQQARDGKVLPMGPQALGSATTYLRRYGVASIVGIAQEDDDGEGASDKNRRGDQEQQEERRPQTSRPAHLQQQAPVVNQDDKLRRDHTEQWSIEEQEEFAALADRLYKAFKVASTNDKHAADAERWRANRAKDPARIVLPAMMKWTETLEAAAAKKSAPADPAAAPAA
jgi:hypothetical protein